jgi:predicted RNase H-like HicB family nuclease
MKKNLEYYLSLPYRLEIVPDTEEGGYAACYPELPGCITCSETLDGLLENAVDAKRAWIKAALEDGLEIQEPVAADDYSGQFKLRIPKSLHKSLAEHSKMEGVSMNQYCVYLLSKNDALHTSS